MELKRQSSFFFQSYPSHSLYTSFVMGDDIYASVNLYLYIVLSVAFYNVTKTP